MAMNRFSCAVVAHFSQICNPVFILIREIAESGSWKLSADNPHDRGTWRSSVRSAMHAASQLPGRGPTDVDVAPVPAH